MRLPLTKLKIYKMNKNIKTLKINNPSFIFVIKANSLKINNPSFNHSKASFCVFIAKHSGADS